MNRDIVSILYLMRSLWQESDIVLWSNGLLLKQFPDLPNALKQTHIRLHITNHSTKNSSEYDRRFDECIELLKSWYEQHEPDISIHYNNGVHVQFARQNDQYLMIRNDVSVGPEGTVWEKFYHGYGKDIKPFNDGDPQASWSNCTSKCPQLYNGRIHKCAPLTYLPLMNEKFGLSEEWAPYLTYQGIAADCTDAELEEFFNRKAESYCGMCPKQRPKFVSEHNPLKIQDKSIL